MAQVFGLSTKEELLYHQLIASINASSGVLPDMKDKREQKRFFQRVILLLLYLLAASATIGIGFVIAVSIWNSRVYDNYPGLADREIYVGDTRTEEGYTREEFSFKGPAGDKVPVFAFIPTNAPKPYPAIVFLYGSGQDRRFGEEIAPAIVPSGFALFVPEQLGQGERRGAKEGALERALIFRERVYRNCAETRALIDVISQRKDIDPKRIYFWGASLGTISGVAPVARDERFAAAVFTMGGGNLYELITGTEYTADVGFWKYPAAALFALLMHPLDPLEHVHRIAPRPVLFQNLKEDELIPTRCARALYEAAGEPKEIRWYAGQHEDLTEEQVLVIIRDGVRWLQGVRQN